MGDAVGGGSLCSQQPGKAERQQPSLAVTWEGRGLGPPVEWVPAQRMCKDVGGGRGGAQGTRLGKRQCKPPTEDSFTRSRSRVSYGDFLRACDGFGF